jgi:hypothetical protein
VAQFSKSGGEDGDSTSDPFMIMVNPLDQSINRTVFNSFTSSILSSSYINIVTKTTCTNLVKLDGVNVSASFAVVPANPLYSFAQISTAAGRHILSSDSGLIATEYGYGWYEAYGANAGTSLYELENYYNITIGSHTFIYYDLNESVCKDTLLTFAAASNSLITDYSWDFGDGSPVVHGQSVSHVYADTGNHTITYYYQTTFCGLDSILWHIKVNECFFTGINDGLPEDYFTFNINPNPTNSIINVMASQKAILEILNIEGQIIKTIKSENNVTAIDVSDLSRGIYIIKARTDKGIAVKKFIKE